jgi:hypothetical protein
MTDKRSFSLNTWVDLLWGPRLKKWIESPVWFRAFVIATAVCLLVYLLNAIVSEIRPYNVWGLSYGTAASILMAGAGLYGLRRRTTKIALKHGLGRAQPWVQFHIYGGTLALLLTFMHSGFHLPTGLLTWWLWILAIWVTASGIFGVLLQKWIPKILASGLATEVVYERIPELINEIREKVEALIQTCADPVKDFYNKNIAVSLLVPQPRLIYYLDITGGIQSRTRQFEYLRSFLSAEDKEELNKLEAFYKTKLEIDAHYTLQRALRWWLYTHVPLSLVLLILIVFHLFAVFYY